MAQQDDGIVLINGKAYKTVAKRVVDFRANPDFADYSISTKVECAAELVRVKATIKNQCGRTISTGMAEEKRDATSILTTSALETCETSAVGRALAFMGRGLGGTEIASADEISGAMKQINQGALDHMVAVREHMDTVMAMIKGMASGDLHMAAEAWFELSEQEQMTLWVATSRGGVFTTDERKIIKTTEFKEAYFGGTD